MINFVLFVLLSGNGFLGIPKADMFSWDAVSIQGGSGRYKSCWMFPSFGASAGRFRWYWGDRISFLLGMELARLHYSLSAEKYDPENPEKINGMGGFEFVEPQIGVAFQGKPRSELIYDCLFPKSQFTGTYIPRVELLLGIVPINHHIVALDWVPFGTIRNELNLYYSRLSFIQLEHRWFPVTGDGHTFHLSICFTLGADIIK